MSDMVGLPFPDYSLAGETTPEHLKNALVLLGGLRHIVAFEIPDLAARAEAHGLVEAISARLDKALAQVEDRHEFGCTAYVGRRCICDSLRKERAFVSRPAATPETQPK